MKCALVVDAVLVEDQGIAQRTDLEQAVPVGRVARQARDFEPEHDSGASHPDLGDQLLESFAVRGRGARLAEIGIDDDDPLVGLSPARRRAGAVRTVALVLSVFSKTCRIVDWRT